MSTMPKPKSIDVGKIIQYAHVFNVRSTVIQGDLEQLVTDFFDLLESRRVSYLLAGDVVLLNYVSGRNTEDLDLIVSISALKQIPELIVSHQDQNFGRGNYRGLQIDLLLTQNTLFEQVQRHYTATMNFNGRMIPCSNVEGLVLLKLYALPSLYRQGDFDRVALYETDLTMLLQHYEIDVRRLMKLLEAHLNTNDIESLSEILSDIQARIKRFKRSSRQ